MVRQGGVAGQGMKEEVQEKGKRPVIAHGDQEKWWTVNHEDGKGKGWEIPHGDKGERQDSNDKALGWKLQGQGRCGDKGGQQGHDDKQEEEASQGQQ